MTINSIPETCRIRVVRFEVRPKVWVRELSRISTNFKSAVQSSVKVRRTFKSCSNFTACIYQNCKGQQPPPVWSHSFLAVKVTCSMIYIQSIICILYQARKISWSYGQTCHTFLNCKRFVQRGTCTAPWDSPVSDLQ